ncbi:MAG: hypothetical protein HY282_12905, partial [Nitrospirae bacterium]|nr:hypothetical protein [Candidatus Manganitrophaceae bacterium]
MGKGRFVFEASVCAIAFLLTLVPFTGTADAMGVWVDHATVKIRPNSPSKPEQASAQLKAARNEFESFQLVVTAD